MLINELIERLEKVRASDGNIEVKIPVMDDIGGTYWAQIDNFDFVNGEFSKFVLLSE